MKLLLSYFLFSVLSSPCDSLPGLSKVDSLQKVITLNDVLVKVNRFEERKREIPYSVSRIRREDIFFQNAPSTAELLLNTGEIFVQKSQAGGGSPVLRGLEASRILLIVDGVRVNNAIFRSGHLQNVLRLDQNILESIDVIYGSSSIAHGSDALGGVIAFNTRSAELNKRSLNASLRYSNAINEKTYHLDYNIGGGKLAWLISLNFSDYGDTKQGVLRSERYPDFGKRFFYVDRVNAEDLIVPNGNVNIQKFSGYSQFDLVNKVTVQSSEKISHEINIQYSLTSDVPRYDRLTEEDNGIPRYASWYYGPENRSLMAYSLNVFDKRLFTKAQMTVAYQGFKESRNSRRFNSEQLISQNEKVDVGSVNFDFRKDLTNHSFTYGAEYFSNVVNSNAFSFNIINGSKQISSTRYPDGGSLMNSYSFFASDKYEILENKFFLNGGLRYNVTNLKAEFIDKKYVFVNGENLRQSVNNMVGNFGLVYLPSNSIKLATNWSSGFRVPNVDDLSKVFDSRPGVLIVPNINLKSEKTQSFDLNLEFNMPDQFSFSSSIYLISFQNILSVLPYNLNGQTEIIYQNELSDIFAVQNAGIARIWGITSSLKAQVSALNFGAKLSYTKGYYLKDLSPLDHIPPLFGRVSVLYPSKSYGRFELFSLFNGWKKLEDYNENGEDNLRYATADGTPAWWTLNFRYSKKIREKFFIQTSLENIFDRNYRLFASGISAPGRNFIIAFKTTL